MNFFKKNGFFCNLDVSYCLLSDCSHVGNLRVGKLGGYLKIIYAIFLCIRKCLCYPLNSHVVSVLVHNIFADIQKSHLLKSIISEDTRRSFQYFHWYIQSLVRSLFVVLINMESKVNKFKHITLWVIFIQIYCFKKVFFYI